MKAVKVLRSALLSVVLILAMILGLGFTGTTSYVKAQDNEHITFNVTVDNVSSKAISLPYSSEIVVRYTVAENTGIDALQLALSYDATAFTLVGVSADNTTALGAAQIGEDENHVFTGKVVFDNVKTAGSGAVYTATGDTLITARFVIKANATPIGAYYFGFVDINDGTDFSNAWRVEKSTEETSTHAPVTIVYDAPTLFVRGTFDFDIEGTTKTYDGAPAQDNEITVSNASAHTPTINFVWFAFDGETYTKLNANPVNAGTYYVVVETEQTDYWNAYCGYTEEGGVYTLTDEEGKVAVYTITQRALTVSFDARSEQYKTFTNSTFAAYLQETGYITITNLVGSETLTPSLDATNILTANAGNYGYISDIILTLADGTGLASNYSVGTISGTFTITQKEIELGNSTYAVFNGDSVDYDGELHTISATISGAYASILSATYTGGENGANGRTSVGISTITATFAISDSNYTFKDNKNTLTATLEIVQTALTQAQVDALVNAYVKFYAVDNGTNNELTVTNHTGSYAKTYDANAAYIGAIVNTADQSKLAATVLYKDGEELAVEKSATALNNFVGYAKTNAGVYTVIITVQPATGYAFANDVNADYTITLTINRAALTITASSTVQYSDVAPVITVDDGVNAWIGTENYATYNTSAEDLKQYVSSTYQNTMVAGTPYAIAWVVGAKTTIDAILTNYNVNLAVATNLTVAKKVINASAYNFTGYQGDYDGANHTLTVIGANEFITYTISSTNTVKNVADSGTYTATITLADAYNYTFENGNNNGWAVDGNSASKSAQVAIATVELTINVAYTKTTATFTVVGFVGGETESVLTNLAYLADGESDNISANVYTISEYVANAITVSATSDNTNYTIANATLKNIRKVEYVAGSYDAEKSGETPVLPATDLLFDGFTTVEPAAVQLNHYTFVCFAVDAGNTAAFDFAQAINANKQVYAIWEINDKYTLTLVYMIEGDASNLIQLAQASYYSDDEINYNAELPSLAAKNWFKVQEWFTNSTLTAKFVGGTTLTEDTTLYANYKFNIGLGDVNGNGFVNANDITLYRQWIVGGYEMEVVEKGNEWAKVNANDFNVENVYFIKRVADSNALTAESTTLGDNHLDIRDVSTMRMALVGGYGFAILEGKNVVGEELVVSRAVELDTISQLLSVAASGTTAKPSVALTEPLFVGSISNCTNDVVIDLNGKTVTLKSLTIALAATNTGKIEIKNGSIYVQDGNGITLSAPSGSVILTDVTFYDKDGQFTLQAANQSLHFDGDVAFRKEGNVPASVVIPASTHVVIEEDATLIIEKIEVEEVAGSTLTIEVKSTAIQELVVDGYAETINDEQNEQNVIVKSTCVEVATKAELTAALADTYVKEIKLTADLVDVGTVVLSANVKLDGNGHRISGNSALSANAAGATIVNTTFENIHNTTALTAAQIAKYNFTRTSGNLTAVYATNLSGKLTIENCNFNSMDWDAIQIVPVAGAEITIKNNEFHNNNEAVRYIHIQSAKNVDFTATIRNNKFYNVSTLNETAIEVYYPANTEKLVITNNYIDSPIGVCVLVQNGTNRFDLVQGFVQEDLTTPMNIVAYIERDNTYLFTSLQDAIDAANNGDTIKLLGNAANGTGIMTKDGQPKNVIIDFGGYTYTVANTTVGSANTKTQAMHWSIDSNVTLKNGTFTVASDVAGIKMAMQNHGVLTIENMTIDMSNVPMNYYGTFTGNDAKYSGLEVPSFCTNYHEGKISAITISNSTLTFNSASNFGVYVETTATITDSTINGTVALSTETAGATATIANSTVSGGVVSYFAGDVLTFAENGNGKTYTVSEGNPAVLIGNSGYLTLADAMSEAKNGDEIVFCTDIEVTNQVIVEKDLILDLNGKTIEYVGTTTLTSGLFGVRRGATLTINDTVGTGKIDAASDKIFAAVALTIKGESANGDVAKVVVNGGTLIGYYYAITGNGSRHDTEIVINNGTLYGVRGTAVYNPQDGTITINGGNLKGGETALEIRAGELTINDGVFETLSDTFSATSNGSGTTVVGAIIAISQHSTLKNITVTINGGTFTNGIRALVMYDTVNNEHSDLMNVTINGGTFDSLTQNSQTCTITVHNGNLIINGGTFNSGADNEGLGCSTVYAIGYGEVTINGGTFSASAKYKNRYWTLNVYNSSQSTAKITVYGGTFVEFDPSNPNTDDSVTYVAEGYTVITVDDVDYDVVVSD